MTPEEEKDCIRKIKRGDKKQQDRFINANIRLVISRVKRFCPLSDYKANDLVNEGSLGLIRAIEDFNPRKKHKFSTYAVWWIDAYIRKGLKFFRKESVVSPNTLKRRYDGAVKILIASTGMMPTDEEVAHFLRWSKEELKLFQKQGGNHKTVTRGVPATITSDRSDPVEKMERIELSERISKVLNRLTPAEEDIIRRRYGIGHEEETLVQIASYYGLAKERIRQIENHALRKLFVYLREKDIRKE